MNLRQLRDVLEVEVRHFREDGDTKSADTLALFANLLEGSDLSIDEFVRRLGLQPELSAPPQVRPNRKRRSR